MFRKRLINLGKKSGLAPGAMLVGMGGATAVLIRGYYYNDWIVYFDGLLAWLTLLVIGKLLWRRSGAYQMSANTLILFILVLPVVDLLHSRGAEPLPLLRRSGAVTNRCYSFEAARGNPAQFRNWWTHYVRQWLSLRDQVQVADPGDGLPFKLKPNSEVRFLSSTFKINSLGFRDVEFQLERTNQFRILAIGESTTMGATMEPDDLPWPKVLEQIIASRLQPRRAVQVINAGVWAYTLKENLIRLEREFQALRPDLIVSYHGYNGFEFLDESLASVRVGPPPAYRERPSPLLAACEHRLRLWWHRRQFAHRLLRPVELERFKKTVLDSGYAELYRGLISWCDTNRVGLALCTFNLAVNEQSPSEVVTFYRGGFPNVHLEIKANRLHNYLLSRLVTESESVMLIDTSRRLDGVWDQYIDLVHFTQQGRNQLAENIFEGLKPMLTQRLSTPPEAAGEAD